MQPSHEEVKSPRLSWAVKRPLWIAGIASLGAVGWPLGDLIYRKEFTSPALWWVFVLAVLFALNRADTAHGHQKILDRLELLESYGDQREANGHLAAARLNGHGQVRQLHLQD